MDAASLKRLLLTLAGVAVAALNKKAGLDLGPAELGAIAAMIATAVGSSNWVKGTLAKADAAGAAAADEVTPANAAAIVKGVAGWRPRA